MKMEETVQHEVTKIAIINNCQNVLLLSFETHLTRLWSLVLLHLFFFASMINGDGWAKDKNKKKNQLVERPGGSL